MSTVSWTSNAADVHARIAVPILVPIIAADARGRQFDRHSRGINGLWPGRGEVTVCWKRARRVRGKELSASDRIHCSSISIVFVHSRF